jgi:hypothetical protein
MKSIAVGKIGKSILFDSTKWGAIGGDNEAPIFYESLFHKNPDITFYLLGSSDYSRIDRRHRDRINLHGNVVDPWADFGKWKTEFGKNNVTDRPEFLMHWTQRNAPNIDVGLFFSGPTGTSNVSGKTYKMKETDELASPLEMLAKYSGPIINYLNDTKLPYAVISTDPRFYPGTVRDLFNRPKIVLSQYTETVNHVSKKSYSSPETDSVKVDCKYSGTETIFLIGKTRGEQIVESVSTLDSFFEDAPEQTSERNIKFMIVCNEGRPSRYPDLKKYILDHVEDVDIYGKWDERTIGTDRRFKGPKKFNDLQRMLPNVKYTFCIPIKKGWVTAKFWEMAHYGIIPFLHPHYDLQNNLKCPEILRVTDSMDLFKKIEFLEKNPEAYDILRSNINAMLKDEYYDGTYLNNLTIKTLQEII